MAFMTHYGHYEFLVMSLCLTNIHVMFMDLMNKVFKPYLDMFIIVFIDDILIYSRNKEDHASHLSIVLQTLKDQELYDKFSKCQFWIESMAFLGHIVSGEGIRVDTQKIETVQNWPKPTSPTDIRSFLVLAGYCRRHLKIHEMSYLTHDLELATIVFAFKIWRHYLYDIYVDVFTDHKSLQYIFSLKEVNIRQKRWLELLKDYEMSILYHPGKSNVVADALSSLSMGSTAHVEEGKKELAKECIDLPVLESGCLIPVKMDGKAERTIQTLNDMLMACVIDFKGNWNDHLPLIEFAYNNNYHSSIQMTPYEALYGRSCRSSIGWFEVGEAELIGPDLVHQAMEKVKTLKERLKTMQSRQKSYMDVRRRDSKILCIYSYSIID
ncbi:hypothetical protein KY284_034494 [Solanum tuberosum]|nr:hypothetical protein KY284_034494 [Solanum tuberosum]